jgi:hypothetical protein
MAEQTSSITLQRIITKKHLVLFSLIVFLFSIISVNAIGANFLCLTKGQTVRFSLCNPAIADRLCTASLCQYCVNEIRPGIYCPLSLNSCNTGPAECTYLNNGTSTQNNTSTKPTFNITLISPTDKYSTQETSIRFSYSLTNSTNASSCSLLIDNVFAASNSSKINSSINIITKTLSPGVYTWSINCADKNGNVETSSQRSLTILTNSSQGNQTNFSSSINITLINPTNNYSAVNPKSILFEYKVTNNTLVSQCNLLINGSVYATNSSKITNSTNNFTKEFSQGIHSWSIKCTDKSGKFGLSESRLLIISSSINNTDSNSSNSSSNSNNGASSSNSNTGQSSSSSRGGGSCSTSWNCGEWSSCQEGQQTRTCSYPANWCKPSTIKPDEKRNCIVQLSDTTNRTNEDNSKDLSTTQNVSSEEEKSNGLSGITGAAIVVKQSNNIWTGLAIICLVLVIISLFYRFRTKKKKK